MVHHPSVMLVLNDVAVQATAGQSLLSVLAEHGHRILNQHPVTGAPRASFCGMGICFECEVFVNGVLRTSCTTLVEDGLEVVIPTNDTL